MFPLLGRWHWWLIKNRSQVGLVIRSRDGEEIEGHAKTVRHFGARKIGRTNRRNLFLRTSRGRTCVRARVALSIFGHILRSVFIFCGHFFTSVFIVGHFCRPFGAAEVGGWHSLIWGRGRSWRNKNKQIFFIKNKDTKNIIFIGSQKTYLYFI